MTKQCISDIKEILDLTPMEDIQQVIHRYRIDDRTGVQKLIKRYEKKLKDYYKELERLDKMSEYERKYKSFNYIAGIDEAGRGPLAGPVVAASVILPKDVKLLYINDSKKLSESKREELYDRIMSNAVSVAVGISTVATIDDINILQATYKAMENAVEELEVIPEVLLIDAIKLTNIKIPQESIVKGDSKSISIAAASIIAKVTRDRMMYEFDKLYPGYGFSKNKGYGTKDHIEAIINLGPCPIHRQSFIKNIGNKE
ncbi:MAG: ribonuclease HII [Eubacteriales bacterium]